MSGNVFNVIAEFKRILAQIKILEKSFPDYKNDILGYIFKAAERVELSVITKETFITCDTDFSYGFTLEMDIYFEYKGQDDLEKIGVFQDILEEDYGIKREWATEPPCPPDAEGYEDGWYLYYFHCEDCNES